MGQTSRPLRTRIIEHKSRIRNKILEAPLIAHFIQHGHSAESLTFFAIEVINNRALHYSNINDSLLKKEAIWIHKLQSLAPTGLNDRIDYSCFFYNF